MTLPGQSDMGGDGTRIDIAQDLFERQEGRPFEVTVLRVPKRDWHVRVGYDGADRLVATCAYEQDAMALAMAVSYLFQFDGVRVVR